ncbi:hypothetical protein [Streptomyces sp. NPDC046942]|uniref:hypothetical protein n=1 Tax=Streptomyces sp. NPDC046942 TaxID=3155137 RepID=UPI0033F894C8
MGEDALVHVRQDADRHVQQDADRAITVGVRRAGGVSRCGCVPSSSWCARRKLLAAREQRLHLLRSAPQLLEFFGELELYAAMSSELVTPGTPHRPGEPRRDLGMASHAVTKTVQDHPDDPASGRREPKEAFHAPARGTSTPGAGRRGGA